MDLIRVEHSDKKYKDWVRIEWNIGKRCNFDCSYCGDMLHDHSSKHLPLEKFDHVLKTMREFYANKYMRMSFTGGEPFVHPKILEVLALCSTHKIDQVSTITNGSLPLKKYQQALELIKHLIFSWHFEFLRVDHMKHVLTNLDRDRIKVHLMYLPGRIQEVKDVIKWLDDNGINYIIRRIRPLTNNEGKFNSPGSSGMNFDGFGTYSGAVGYYSNEELEHLGSLKAGKFNNCEFFTKEERWLDNVNTLTKNKWNSFKHWHCMAGIESLYINSIGNIYRATCKQGGVLGNIETGFQLQEDPILCAKQWCNCAADLNITKWLSNA